MRRLIEKFYALATGKVFALSAVVFVLFLAVVLPREAERSEAYFGDTSTPDTSFIYTSEDLYRMAGDSGEDGRAYYIRSRFTFDVVWPLVYGLFLWAGIAYFGRPGKDSVGRTHSIARYAPVLPLLAVVLDFLENSSASLVMYFYPDRLPVVSALTPAFTFTKWVSITVSFAAFGILAVVYLVHQLRHRE